MREGVHLRQAPNDESVAAPTGTPPSDNPFRDIKRPSNSRVRQTWSVGGGKGGVGKSMIASSLAISLARQGHKVIAIDLDLGGANLHTTLGIDQPKQTLGDFVAGRTQSLQDCVVATPVQNLEIISGAHDSVAMANISPAQKAELIRRFRDLDAEYLLFDLGAGTGANTIDFFLYSDIGIVTLLPEPTSIENAYRFIKSAYYRRLQVTRSLASVRHLVEMAMDAKNPLDIKSPSDLFRAVSQQDPEIGQRLRDEVECFRPKLVVNQARTQTDIDIGFSVKSVCKRYFGIEMDYVGYLDYDSSVWQAVRKKRPLMLEFPNSRLVSSVDRISQYLVKRHGHAKNELY